jgi:hypothetical protein
MDQTAIFAPFFSMMLLTLAVWVLLFVRRVPFIQNGNLTPEQLSPVEFTRISPPAVSTPSDNLKNLFELPIIFYALVLYLHATQQVDTTYVAAAWTFVAFRALHSAVHCTINIVTLRFGLYCVSSLALWFMVVRGAWQAMG